MLGLVPPFFHAAAGSVLGTLWPVAPPHFRNWSGAFGQAMSEADDELQEKLATDSKCKRIKEVSRPDIIDLARCCQSAGVEMMSQRGENNLQYYWGAFALFGFWNLNSTSGSYKSSKPQAQSVCARDITDFAAEYAQAAKSSKIGLSQESQGMSQRVSIATVMPPGIEDPQLLQENEGVAMVEHDQRAVPLAFILFIGEVLVAIIASVFEWKSKTIQSCSKTPGGISELRGWLLQNDVIFPGWFYFWLGLVCIFLLSLRTAPFQRYCNRLMRLSIPKGYERIIWICVSKVIPSSEHR